MERRLSAIFAADMVGYSRLIEADEVGTLERQKAYRSNLIDPKFDQHHGRIVKEMGDGILVEFPSIVEAVHCALAIQREMAERETDFTKARRIQYRIGINLGDVVVENGDLFGDGVNVAARLEAIAEPGGICISGTAYDQMRSIEDVNYDPLGEVVLKNIERPIRAYRVLTGAKQVASEVHKSQRLFGPQYRAAIAFSLVLAILGGWYWWYMRPEFAPRIIDQESTSRNSIAVLPFDNLSGDPEQDYFVDGMTDDLITDLSKLASLFVIARNSVFAYKGLDIEPDKVAHDLGVRYILDGSVRAVGGRVRINSRLIDTETGGQIWAERFDRDLKDVFALQDDVTSQIVAAMAVELTSDEQRRLNFDEKETTPAVYDLYLRGVESLRQFTPESVVRARGYFLNALALDPDYGRAYAALAFTYTVNSVFFNEPNVDEALSEALRYGKRALDIDPTLPQGHFAMAIALLRQGQHSEAMKAARNAIKYDPNYADGYVALANVLTFSGKGREAVDAMSKAVELNPRYSAAYLDIFGRALFVVGNYLEAAKYLEECVSRDPGSLSCHTFLAVIYALNGQPAEAEWQAEEVRSMAPEFSIANNNISYQFKHKEQRDIFEEGLRLAGFRNGEN